MCKTSCNGLSVWSSPTLKALETHAWMCASWIMNRSLNLQPCGSRRHKINRITFWIAELGGGGHPYVPAALPPGKEPAVTVRYEAVPQSRSGRGCEENSCLSQYSNPGRPSRSLVTVLTDVRAPKTAVADILLASCCESIGHRWADPPSMASYCLYE
jgi:hypothetical protein